MRKALLTFALTLLLVFAFVGVQAQTTTFYSATSFNWAITGQQANTYTFFPISLCQVPGGQQPAGTFFPFNTNASVFIQDAVVANNEVVTPATVVKTSAQCGITATPTHSHYSFVMRSGTAGLQEALNTLSNTATQKTPVILDKNWYVQLSATGQTAATVIGAAAGSSGVYLVDVTTSPFTFYSWSGTAYVASSGSGSSGTISKYCTGTVGSAETEFLNDAACSAATTSTVAGQYIASGAGTLSGLRVVSSATVVGGTGKDVATVVKNGTPTAITCTIAASGTSCTDSTHSVAVAAGDVISFQFVTATSDTAADIQAVVTQH